SCDISWNFNWWISTRLSGIIGNRSVTACQLHQSESRISWSTAPGHRHWRTCRKIACDCNNWNDWVSKLCRSDCCNNCRDYICSENNNNRSRNKRLDYRSLPVWRLESADLIFRIPKCIAHEIQYHLSTVGAAMYAPWALNSFAKVCSTKFSLDVTFFALSRGTVAPQFVHWIRSEEPFPPFFRPRLARFSGMFYLYGASL